MTDIDPQRLKKTAEALLEGYAEGDRERYGAVNWGDLSVVDIEERRSLLHPTDPPVVVVMIEEVSPGSGIQTVLREDLAARGFDVAVEADW